ncbi:MAG: hypothetical protein F4064_00325 [Acidimicrobiales bacterium]|nr:hypothetical protein [Acidimicrobiales bacterium]MYI26516.1 hypothetical protein [Acidimicrobiales bacterium]
MGPLTGAAHSTEGGTGEAVCALMTGCGWDNCDVAGVIDELLRRIAEFHRSRTAVPEYPMVATVLDALDEARSPALVEARHLPVLRHLDAVKLCGDGVPRTAGPGDAVHHAPWQPHQQDFGATPTVLLYCWTGEVVADAALVEGAC